MSEAITDRDVVRVLRPFVRATSPVLDALREADFLGLRGRSAGEELPEDADRRTVDRLLDRLARMRVPGTAAWAVMDIGQRTDWWVNRVGRVTALLAAVPGIGGALADRLPIQDALGAAGQGLVLCAVAGEYGVDEAERGRLLAAVLFQRDITPELAVRPAAGSSRDEDDRRTAELAGELTESRRRHGRVTLRAVARTVWRLGRALWSLEDELGRRPQGRLHHQVLGALPGVGMIGDYLGERSALRRAARQGVAWITARPPTAGRTAG